MAAIQQQNMERFVPFTGQSAGLITDIRPARDIVRSLVEEARAALQGISAVMTRNRYE